MMRSKAVLLILLLATTSYASEKSYEVNELTVIEDVVYEVGSGLRAEGLLNVFYDDGELKTQVPFKHGKSSGVEKKFYPNGMLASAVPFLDGKEHGVAKRYFGSGGLYIVTTFEYGLKDGISKEYYSSGSIKSEILYEKGIAVKGDKYLEDGTKRSVPKELLNWIQPNTGLY